MAESSTRATAHIRVWDLPTRIFHLAIILLIAYLWWSEKNDDIADHKLAGFALTGLVVFRLYWGVFGSESARFSNFLRGPRAAWRYITRRAAPALGHSPLGGWSVAALLALIAIACVSGLFAIDEDGLEAGPFAPDIGLDWAQFAAHVHALVFDALLALIAVHVTAIIIYALAGKNLVLPMITGRVEEPEGAPPLRFASFWRFLIGIVLAAGTAYVLWRLDNA